MRNKAYDAKTWKAPGTNRSLIVILSAIFVCVTVCFCASSNMDYLPFLIVGWCGVFTVLCVRNFLNLMWFGMIFFIPMGLNIFIAAEKSDFNRAVCGIAIGAEDICLLGLIGYLLFQTFIRRERTLYMPKHILWLSGLLLFCLFLASLKVENKLYAISAFFAAVRCWAFMFVVINFMRTEKDLIFFIIAIAACVWFQSLLGLLQIVMGGFDMGVLTGASELKTNVTGTMEFSRCSGTQGSANSLGLLLNIGLVLVFCIFMSRLPFKQIWLRIVAGATIALALPVDVLTYSRGAWLALAIAIVWVLLHFMHYYLGSMLKAVMITVVFSAIAACFALAFEPIRERCFGADYGSVEMRVPMIEVSMECIAQNPVRGVGLGEYTKYVGSYNKTPYALGTVHPYPVHSMFFLLAAEAGIPTLIVYLAFFLVLCSYGFNFTRRAMFDKEPLLPFVGTGLVFALIAFIIQGQLIVYVIYARPMLWLFYGGIIAVARMLDERLKAAEEESSQPVAEQV